MSLKLILFCFSFLINSSLFAQLSEFEKIRVLFRQNPIQFSDKDSLMVERIEVIWITLIIKDSTVVGASAALADHSWYRHHILSLLEKKLIGYKLGTPRFDRIVIPLMMGYFSNKTALTVKAEWDLLESLRTKDLQNYKSKNRAVIYPIFNVIGTYAPPKKVRRFN